MKKIVKWMLMICLVLLPMESFAVVAFPGAEGYGANTIGGRGSSAGPYSFSVYEVTNLNDSGAGSLRAAVQASGPRFVIFKTGGTITLSSTLNVSNPYITIAGQTAPGGGITIKGADFNIATHDVVVRYLTFRRGPGGENHAVSVSKHNSNDVYNIVVDHCSISWGTDECLGQQYRVYNMTASWNMIYEGLNCSTHSKGCHSKGGMFAGRYMNNDATAGGAYNITLHHNLLAHNGDRNPLFDLAGAGQSVNNVTYNAKSRTHSIYDRGEYTRAAYNIIKNYSKAGPHSATKPYTVQVWKYTPNSISFGMYVEGNIDSYRTSDSLAQNLCVESGSRGYLAGSRYSQPSIKETSAAQAYADVIADGGAGNSRMLNADGAWTNRRDAHDARVINDVKNAKASYGDGLINDPSNVGGWLSISAGTGYKDSDRDGMPDAWETAKGLNPNNAADARLDSNGNGYSNLEEFLNGSGSAASSTTYSTTSSQTTSSVPPSSPSGLKVSP